MRVDEKLLTLQLLQAAKRANFWMIFYGVESGCQRILDKIKKGIMDRAEEIVEGFRKEK